MVVWGLEPAEAGESLAIEQGLQVRLGAVEDHSRVLIGKSRTCSEEPPVEAEKLGIFPKGEVVETSSLGIPFTSSLFGRGFCERDLGLVFAISFCRDAGLLRIAFGASRLRDAAAFGGHTCIDRCLVFSRQVGATGTRQKDVDAEVLELAARIPDDVLHEHVALRPDQFLERMVSDDIAHFAVEHGVDPLHGRAPVVELLHIADAVLDPEEGEQVDDQELLVRSGDHFGLRVVDKNPLVDERGAFHRPGELEVKPCLSDFTHRISQPGHHHALSLTDHHHDGVGQDEENNEGGQLVT